MTKKSLFDKLTDLSIEEIAELHPQMLCELLKEDAIAYKRIVLFKELLEASLHRRYGVRAHFLRTTKKTDTGIISFNDREYIVTQNIPEIISWDQKLLAEVASNLLKNAENPSEYMNVTFSISDIQYAALSKNIRSILNPARKIVFGTPSYTLSIDSKKLGGCYA